MVITSVVPRVNLTVTGSTKVGPHILPVPEICKCLYTLANIGIDKCLVHFTGRLAIKQNLPIKCARYEVKLYKLCERATGYTYHFRIYVGKDSQVEPCAQAQTT